jgi:hypothetical protein
VDNRVTVENFGVCAPPTDAKACTVSAGACSLYLADRPFVYTTVNNLPNELLLFLQFNNQSPNNADPEAGRPNTHDFFIDRFEFHFTSYDLTAPLAADRYLASGVPVPANGIASTLVPIIPATEMPVIKAAMAAAGVTHAVVTSEITTIGHFADGSDFKTPPFMVPVDVFNKNFGSFVCPTAGEVVVAVCPNNGQTSSIACAAP